MILNIKLRCRLTVVSISPGSDSSKMLRIREGGAFCILLVTGGAVVCKPYDRADPIVRRIEGNPALLVTVNEDNSLCYVRKDLIEPMVLELERSGNKVLEVIACESVGNMDIDALVSEVSCRCLSLRAVTRDRSLVDFIAGKLFRRLLLPVLMSCFAILVVNLFVFSALEDRLDRANTERAELISEARERIEVTDAKRRLAAELEGIPTVCIAQLVDAFAVVLPEGVRLSSLTVNDANDRYKTSVPSERSIAIVGGEAVSADAVMLFADALRICRGVSSMTVASLEKESGDGLFHFVINIGL